MNPVEPSLHQGAVLIEFAKDQPPYMTLPASVDVNGTVMTEWEFTAEELQKVLTGGKIRLWVMFTKVHEGIPISPLRLEVIEPEYGYGS